MATEIKDMLDSIPGVRVDWKEDWKEDAKADWKYDWDAIPGDAPAAAPVNTVLPAITGTAQDGQVLSVSDGTWTGNPVPTYTYQWFVDVVPQAGEIANTYTCKTADVGQTVYCEVTATNTEGAVIAAAPAVGPVVA